MIKKALAIIPYALLLVAAIYLGRELRGVEWDAFTAELAKRPWSQIALALGLIVINYGVFSAYDFVALRQVGVRAPALTVIKSAALSFSLTNLLGYSMITGVTFRLRELRRFGMTLGKVTGLILQNIEVWWLGFLFMGGVVLTTFPRVDAKTLIDPSLIAPVGFGLFALIAIYLLVTYRFAGRTLRVWRAQLHLPDIKGGFAKIAVGASDILVTALTLYMLLPTTMEIEFHTFFTFYLLAHVAGVISMVPGGLGVIESVILSFLRPYGADATILASLVLYRLMRYLLPPAITLAFELVRLFHRSRKDIYEIPVSPARF